MLTNLNYHYRDYISKKNDISHLNGALVAPSRNLLSPKVFKSNKKLPITHHCVGMSLHFISRYRVTKNIQFTANTMKDGADDKCAQTSMLYGTHFKNRPENARNDTAQSLGIKLDHEFTLYSPIEQIIHYIKHELPNGEFIIPLWGHVIALIKTDNDNIYVFDPNCGTVNIIIDEGKNWFVTLLKKYRIDLKETLNFLSDVEFKDKEIEFPSNPLNLAFEKGHNRWGKVKVQWREKEYFFVWDTITGYIYNDNSKNFIRLKCVPLLFRTVIAKTIRLVVNVVKSAFYAIGLIFSIINENRRKTYKEELFKSIIEIISLPFYTVLLTTISLYGMLKPYEGRRLYNYFERNLNDDIRQVNVKKIRYSAPCFNPLCISDDMKVQKKALRKSCLEHQYVKLKSNEFKTKLRKCILAH